MAVGNNVPPEIHLIENTLKSTLQMFYEEEGTVKRRIKNAGIILQGYKDL